MIGIISGVVRAPDSHVRSPFQTCGWAIYLDADRDSVTRQVRCLKRTLKNVLGIL